MIRGGGLTDTHLEFPLDHNPLSYCSLAQMVESAKVLSQEVDPLFSSLAVQRLFTQGKHRFSQDFLGHI